MQGRWWVERRTAAAVVAVVAEVSQAGTLVEMVVEVFQAEVFGALVQVAGEVAGAIEVSGALVQVEI